jgi:hypothetical protein
MATLVGRTPTSAADALVGLLLIAEIRVSPLEPVQGTA